jgi:hypothetical protein
LTKARARCDSPSPSGGRPCFSIAGHLAEGRVVSVGQEHRIVAEAGGAARRPDQRAVDARLEFLEMAVGPGDAQRRDEMRARCSGVARRVPAAGVRSASSRGEILVLAGPARRIDAGRAVERVDHQSGIVGERRQPPPCAAASALMRALARNVVPVSSGSPRPSSPADTASTPCGASSSRISASLPGLWVAITSGR